MIKAMLSISLILYHMKVGRRGSVLIASATEQLILVPSTRSRPKIVFSHVHCKLGPHLLATKPLMRSGCYRQSVSIAILNFFKRFGLTMHCGHSDTNAVACEMSSGDAMMIRCFAIFEC